VPNPETRLSFNRLGLLVKKGGQPSRLAQIGGVASLYYAKIHRPSLRMANHRQRSAMCRIGFRNPATRNEPKQDPFTMQID